MGKAKAKAKAKPKKPKLGSAGAASTPAKPSARSLRPRIAKVLKFVFRNCGPHHAFLWVAFRAVVVAADSQLSFQLSVSFSFLFF